METAIRVRGKTFRVSASKCWVTDHFPGHPGEMIGSRCNHMVKVKLGDRSVKFRYTNSTAAFGDGIRTMDRGELKRALTSFLDDAIYGSMSFDEFKDELGYRHDSGARKFYKAVQGERAKAERLGLSEDEFREIANALDGR